jgi:hypothetical protein
MPPNDETRNYISSQKKSLSANKCGVLKQHEVTPNQFNLDPYYYYPPISHKHLTVSDAGIRATYDASPWLAVCKIPKQWRSAQPTGKQAIIIII